MFNMVRMERDACGKAANLTESRSSRAAYLTVNRKVHYDGKSIQVNVAINILHALVNLVNHPFNSDNCYNFQHLSDLHKKRA